MQEKGQTSNFLKDPIGFLDRIVAPWKRQRENMRNKRPWVYLGLFVLAAIIVAAAGNVFGQTAQDSVFKAGKALLWVLKLPLWAGIGALVVWFGVLVGISWYETRPRLGTRVRELQSELREARKHLPQPEQPRLKPTGEERDLIQDYRVLWNDYADYPARELYSIMHSLVYNREDIYWVKLLARFRDGLKSASEEMANAVSDDDVALRDVRKAFNAFFEQYATAFIWFAEVRANERVEDSSLGAAGDVQRWLTAHRRLRRAVWNLAQRPGHKNQINNEILSYERRAYADLEHPIDGAFDAPPGTPQVTRPTSLPSGPSSEAPVLT